MAANFPVKRTNETIDQIPEVLPNLLGDELDEKQIATDVNNILGSLNVNKDKKTEEEKNHLTAFAQQMANLDESEGMIAAKIMADKYPDIMFNALMGQMYDLMKSRDEINKSLSIYFGKRNEVYTK